jgi:hypothetical protein
MQEADRRSQAEMVYKELQKHASEISLVAQEVARSAAARDVTATDDAMQNLLPLSSGIGLNYRSWLALRVAVPGEGTSV